MCVSGRWIDPLKAGGPGPRYCPGWRRSGSRGTGGGDGEEHLDTRRATLKKKHTPKRLTFSVEKWEGWVGVDLQIC